jgi:hypothetical protein
MRVDDVPAFWSAIPRFHDSPITIVSVSVATERAVSYDFGEIGNTSWSWNSMMEFGALPNEDFSRVWQGDSENGVFTSGDFSRAWQGEDGSYFMEFASPPYSIGWFREPEYDSAQFMAPPDTVPLGPSKSANPPGSLTGNNNLGIESPPLTPPPSSPSHGTLLGPSTPGTTAPPIPTNNGFAGQGPGETFIVFVSVVPEAVTITNSGVSTTSEASPSLASSLPSLPSTSLSRTPVVSAKQTGPVIAATDAALNISVRSTPAVGSVTTTSPDRAVVVGALPTVTDRRPVDSSNASGPIAVVVGKADGALGPSGNESTPSTAPRTGPVTLPPQQTTGEDSSATEETPPALDAAVLPLPQGAGLLDGEFPLGLAGLESALRALTGAEATGRSESNLLLRGVVLGSWMLSATLGWAVIRRRSSLPEVGLGDALSLSPAGPPEEELP